MEAKRKLGEILSAFEFLDNPAMDLVSLHLHIFFDTACAYRVFSLLAATVMDHLRTKLRLEYQEGKVGIKMGTISRLSSWRRFYLNTYAT